MIAPETTYSNCSPTDPAFVLASASFSTMTSGWPTSSSSSTIAAPSTAGSSCSSTTCSLSPSSSAVPSVNIIYQQSAPLLTEEDLKHAIAAAANAQSTEEEGQSQGKRQRQQQEDEENLMILDMLVGDVADSSFESSEMASHACGPSADSPFLCFPSTSSLSDDFSAGISSPNTSVETFGGPTTGVSTSCTEDDAYRSLLLFDEDDTPEEISSQMIARPSSTSSFESEDMPRQQRLQSPPIKLEKLVEMPEELQKTPPMRGCCFQPSSVFLLRPSAINPATLLPATGPQAMVYAPAAAPQDWKGFLSVPLLNVQGNMNGLAQEQPRILMATPRNNALNLQHLSAAATMFHEQPLASSSSPTSSFACPGTPLCASPLPGSRKMMRPTAVSSAGGIRKRSNAWRSESISEGISGTQRVKRERVERLKVCADRLGFTASSSSSSDETSEEEKLSSVSQGKRKRPNSKSRVKKEQTRKSLDKEEDEEIDSTVGLSSSCPVAFCVVDGCDRLRKGKNSYYCVRHGGGRRCQYEGGCDRAAQSRGLCKRHGGGQRCQYADCQNSSQGGRRCRRHGGGRRCQIDGCDKGAQRDGFCAAHGGVRMCQVRNCERHDRGGGRCAFHGGGKRCSHPGCDKPARKRGQCAVHFTTVCEENPAFV